MCPRSFLLVPLMESPLLQALRVKSVAVGLFRSGKSKLGCTPKGSYSPRGHSRHLLETSFSEPLLRTLLGTRSYCETKSKPPSKNPSENPSPEPSQNCLEVCIVVRPLRRAPKKRGPSKQGLGPKGTNQAKKASFRVISALRVAVEGSGPKAPIGPEKAQSAPHQDFPIRVRQTLNE